MTQVTIVRRTDQGTNLTAAEVDTNFTGLQTRAHQLKTSGDWATNGSTVLAAGQMGIETNTGLFKVGNGTSTWAQLLYSNSFMVQSTWADRPTTGLVVGQFGDFSADFGITAPLFRWTGTRWMPTGPVVIGSFTALTHTGVTAETLLTAATITIPSGLISAGGWITSQLWATMNASNANTKNLRIYIDSTAGTSIPVANTNKIMDITGVNAVLAAGETAFAYSATNAGFGHNVTSPSWHAMDGWQDGLSITSTIDTTVAPTYLKLTAQLGLGTDTITVRSWRTVWNPGR